MKKLSDKQVIARDNMLPCAKHLKVSDVEAKDAWFYINRRSIIVYTQVLNGRIVAGVTLTRSQLEKAIKLMDDAK